MKLKKYLKYSKDEEVQVSYEDPFKGIWGLEWNEQKREFILNYYHYGNERKPIPYNEEIDNIKAMLCGVGSEKKPYTCITLKAKKQEV